MSVSLSSHQVITTQGLRLRDDRDLALNKTNKGILKSILIWLI